MRYCLFVAIFFLLLAIGRAQSGNDSIMIKEARSAFTLANAHPDSALVTAISAIRQSTVSGNKRLAAYAYKTKGWAWFRLGNYDSCFSDLLTSISLFRQLRDSVELMYMYMNLANVYSSHSQFTETADYLMRADSIAVEKNDLKIQAAEKKQMGVLYREQGKNNQAVQYFKESMAISQQLKDTMHLFDAASSLSMTYNLMSHADSSLALLREISPMINAMPGYYYQKAMLHERFGDSYFNLKAYPQALDNYKIAYSVFLTEKNKADMAYEGVNIGKTYVQAGNYIDAEKYLLEAYLVNESLGMTHYAHDAAKELAALYQKTNNWQKAFQWLDKTNTLNDSLQLVDQNEKIAGLQAKYETEKKDKQISLLKKDQELNLLTLQKQETLKYGAVALLILLSLIGLLATNRYRVVQRAKRLVEMEKLRNDIARDLHDDMGSSLSSINIISKMALENAGDNRDQLKKINDNSGYMLESMSDIVWAISPSNDKFEKVIFKMKEFAADILEPLNIQYEFILGANTPDIQTGLTQRKDLYLIFKEAVNNAAKYSQCTKVTIKLQGDNHQFLLEVSDNGIGFDTTTARPAGNGLKNMKQRAVEINGKLEVISIQGKGTIVTISIRSHE